MTATFSDFFEQSLALPKVLAFNAAASASMVAPDDFLKIYPTLLDDLDVKQGNLGQFHTKSNIIEIVLSSLPSDYIDRITCGAKMIDPSCGTANFLIHVIEKAIEHFKHIGLSTDDAYRAVNQNVIPNLAGAEIDPVLVKAARLNIQHTFGSKIECPELHILDALDLVDCSAINLLGGKFDFVVGNPPWVEVKRLPDKVKEAVQRKYLVSNLYGAFILQGINFLKRGGSLSYVIPRSFTGGRYYFKLRQFLSKETSLNKLSYYTNRNQEFHGGDVLQEIVVVSLTNSRPGPRHDVFCLPCNNIENFSSGTSFKINQSDLFSRHDSMMLLAQDPLEFEWMKKISSFPNFEDHGFSFSTGQLVLHRCKDFLKSEPDDGCFRILYGHDIINDSGKFSFQKDIVVKKGRHPYATTIGRKNFDGRRSQLGFADTESTIENYCNRYPEIILCRRRSHKGDKRRFVGIFLSSDIPDAFFLENGLNFIVSKSERPIGSPSLKAFYRIMRSDLFERYFQIVSSNTQLNKNDMYLFGIPSISSRTASIYESLEQTDENDLVAINLLVEDLYS
jgi:hypothetical protein